jgi:hypothetical protein
MKKYFINLGFLLYGLFTLASCTIQEEVHFNKDFSGKMNYSLDMGSMMGMMAGMTNALDSSKEDMKFKPEMMASMFDGIKDLEGVSNFNSAVGEDGKITFSFDFKNLDALNRAYNRLSNSKNMDKLGKGNFMPGMPPASEDSTETSTEPSVVEEAKPDETFVYFAKEGKDLVFRRPKMGGESADLQGMGDQMEMLKGMGEMLKVETKLTFDRKIKKAEAKGIDLSDKAEKSVLMKLDFQALRKETTPEVRIRLK